VDERQLLFRAEQQLLQAENLLASRNKGLIDRKGSVMILQQWLDERRSRIAVIEAIRVWI